MGISNETGCFELDSRETISSLSGQVLIAVTFTITALFALVGNVLVIVVQLFGKRSPRNMRKYLINLAISDVLLSFCVPFSFTDAVYRRWLFYHFLCPATQWLQLVTVFVTAFTLSLIGVERYIATLHPLCGLHKWLQSHCSALLVMTWLLAIAYGITPLRHTTTKEFIFKDAVYVECSMSENDWEWSIEPQLFHLANFILTYAGPVLLLSFTYSQIILKFMRIQRRKRAQQRSLEALNVMSVSSNNKQTNETAVAGNSGGKSQQQQKQQHQQQYQQPSHQQQPTVQLSRRRISAGIQLRRTPRVDNRALTIRLLVVILMYVLCWTPIKVYQILSYYELLPMCSEQQLFAHVYSYIFCTWFAMANSFVNPLIYSWSSKSFRKDLQQIFETMQFYICKKMGFILEVSTTDAVL